MTEHTPGPWKIVEDRNNHWGMVEIEGPAVTVRGLTVATNVDAATARRITADARLIAAAPEMYELLRSIENDDNSVPDWLWQRISEVVDKAEGRTAALNELTAEAQELGLGYDTTEVTSD